MKEKPKKKDSSTPSSSPNGDSLRGSTGSAKRAVAPSTVSSKPYMIQVSSFRKLSHARALESKLQQKGYPAFVMSVEVSKAKGVWYRVFLGKYQTEANARAVAQKAQRRHNLKTIVLKSSK